MAERIMDGGNIKDKPLFTRRDILRAGSIMGLSVFMAACAPKIVSTLTSEPDPAKNSPTEKVPGPEIVTSGVLTEITDKAQHDQIVGALPSNRPEAYGGNEGIKTFKITAGGRDFNFAGYDLTYGEIQKQVVVQLTDKDGNKINVTQTKALYAEYVGYDGKSSYERLVMATSPQYGADGESTGNEAITWLYNQSGFPTKNDQTIDLNRPVLGYLAPLKTDSSLSFSPLVSDAKLLVKYNVPNPITVTQSGANLKGLDVSIDPLSQKNFGEPVSAIATASPEAAPVSDIPLPLGTEVSTGKVTFKLLKTKIDNGSIRFTSHYGFWEPGTYQIDPNKGFKMLTVYGTYTGDKGDVRNLFKGPYKGLKTLYIDNGLGGKGYWTTWDIVGSTITLVFSVPVDSTSCILNSKVGTPWMMALPCSG